MTLESTENNNGGSRHGGGRLGIGTRRTARELALQMLFQNDVGDSEPEITAHTFEAYFSPQTDEDQSLQLSATDFSRAWPLACELFFGATAHQPELDEGIGRASVNWTLARMSAVDRGLIRLAYYEMIYRDDIPAKVSLNEALEIAKVFGDEDSRPFINGVLDRLMRSLENRKIPEVASFEADRFEADRFEADRFEADRFEADSSEADSFEADRFEADRFEADRFEADSSEADSSEADRFEADRFEDDRFETEKFEDEG